jgi:flagellar assembly protein FliH
MSPSSSARRLSATVATNRFAWQGSEPPAPTVVMPALRSAPAPVPAPVVPTMCDQPTPSVERLETIERDAYERGYADGERAGIAATEARVEEVVARLAATIEEIAGLRTGVMRRAERDLVRLAIAMAERVLRREVDIDRELLVVMARVAIDRLGENGTATIHLHPSDHDAVVARRSTELGPSVELVADPAVPRCGCLVRSPFGTIDVGIESQVRELSRALLGDDAADTQEGTDGAMAGA